MVGGRKGLSKCNRGKGKGKRLVEPHQDIEHQDIAQTVKPAKIARVALFPFSEQQKLDILQWLKINPMCWDTSDPGYKAGKTKDHLWTELATTLVCKGEDQCTGQFHVSITFFIIRWGWRQGVGGFVVFLLVMIFFTCVYIFGYIIILFKQMFQLLGIF